MQVRQGWSGEVKPNTWAKFDLELEEEDLRRILMTHQGYDPAIQVDLNTAYKLLELEAERLVTAKLAQRYGFDSEAAATVIRRLNQDRTKILNTVYGSSTKDSE